MSLTDRRTFDRRASVRRVHCATEKTKTPIVAASMLMAEVAPDSDNATMVRTPDLHVIPVQGDRRARGGAQAQLRSALDSVNDNVAVLDRYGNIVMTNVAWQQFALAYRPEPKETIPHSDVGTNYLNVASRGTNEYDGSGQAAQGIREVLAGNVKGFSLRYPCHTPNDQYWFTMTVIPMEWKGQRGALVMHTDTTPCHHLRHH